MTPEQEQVIEEQQALLEESAKMYTGEMEPETKTVEPPKTPEYIEVANGVPAGPGGPVMGAPVSRSAWSTDYSHARLNFAAVILKVVSFALHSAACQNFPSFSSLLGLQVHIS
jgi:hypothetical protein